MKHVTICGTDLSRFSIVLKKDPAPAERTAADFLRRVFSVSAGIEVPVVCESAPHGICLGSRPSSEAVKWDGFRITAREGNLFLDGNVPRGTLYAAFSLAERFLGYRYFSDDTEVIPTDGNADISDGFDIVDNPGFEGRRTTICAAVRSPQLSAHLRLNDCMPVDESLGGTVQNTGDCHSFARLCPPELYYDSHPEYYALLDGKRIRCGNVYNVEGQLCLTNPDVLKIVTENVLKELRANPGRRIVEVSQCDTQLYCTCEKCAAIDAEEGSPSGTLIRFVNAVAEEVEKEFPDVLVRTFAYQYTRKAPKITRARRNVLIRYCTIEACFRHALNDPACERNGTVFGPELEEWQKMADQLSIWDYVTNWKCYIAPFPNLISLWKNARLFAECKAIHVLEESASGTPAGGVYSDLKTYLIGKLLWDPRMSEETYNTYINEFLEAYYGPGWQEVRRYIDLEHEVTADKKMRCFADVDISAAFSGLSHEVEAFMLQHYEAKPYQPVYPNPHYLDDLIPRLPEAEGCFKRAAEQAETELQRMHVERSLFSLTYVRLFCTKHDRKTMSDAERAEYEAEVEKFYQDKKKYGYHYNISTTLIGN